MSHRRDQVASSIRRAVQSILDRGLQDPRVRGLISVTRVTLDDPLSHAVVHVSVLPAERAELTMQGLDHATPRIRSQISRSVRLRRLPRLSFHLDDSIKKQARFEADLAEGRHGSGDETQTEELVP